MTQQTGDNSRQGNEVAPPPAASREGLTIRPGSPDLVEAFKSGTLACTGNSAISGRPILAEQSQAASSQMDVEWITIGEELMPIKLMRGRSAADCTLDFMQAEGRKTWGLGNVFQVAKAWKTICKVQPGLIIDGEASCSPEGRDEAASALKKSADHIHAFVEMYEHQ